MWKRCFIAMPFDGSCETVYRQAIRPACTQNRVRCIRVDVAFGAGKIMDDVVRGIFDADLLIANLTGLNANVFYELGVRQALSYPDRTICMARGDTRIPFDINAYRVVMYDENRLAVCRRQLVRRVREALLPTAMAANPVHDAIPYYDSLVLPQSLARERHGLSLEECILQSRTSLVLVGTTLHSIRGQPIVEMIKSKLRCATFKRLILVGRHPSASDVSTVVATHLREFANDPLISDLMALGMKTRKLTIYSCSDFVRYSASYIDHESYTGRIRITHPIYGSRLEDSPSYLITRKHNPVLYKALVHSWNDLRRRSGTRRVLLSTR
jgi:hypothetical protein